ncbi:peroxynitrite isomerase THAP4-like [Saccostrea cucullata]|uniref:peroxynitrite isomerase THAP4-like n=1 Tax=Saccostrea cuccullata TaxID=36930 RepID=UPI002ED501FC
MTDFRDSPIHDALKPLEWLIGKWKGEGKGTCPISGPFEYTDEIEFFHVGQPMLQFSLYSINKKTSRPHHRELGFLKIKPGTNEIAWIAAHNNAISEIQEGTVEGQSIELESNDIRRKIFFDGCKMIKVKRSFKREGDTLHQIFNMETDAGPLTEHLNTTYHKV